MIKSLVKYGFAAFFSLFVVGVAFAQPTFNIEPAQTIANNGDRICLEIEVDDFTDILTIDFDYEYDPSVMTYDDIASPALAGLTSSNFVVVTPGILRFSWTAPNAGAGIGEDFPDFQPIVRICFDIVGAYGSSTPIKIAPTPTPRITRQNSGNRNIGLFEKGGLVAVGVLPLHIIIGNGGAAEGSSVCIPVRANGFTDIVSFQYSVNWDPTVLSYTGATSLNPGLPGLRPGSISSSGAGELAVLYPFAQGTSPETLPDSSLLFQLCFDIVGTCDETSVVEVTGTPVPIDVYNSQSSQPIGLTSNDGQVDVFNCGGGLRLIGATRTASPGDDICIPFEVQGFQNINAMDFDIDFNPSILAYDDVIVSPGAPTFFNLGSFDISQVATGKIRVTWTGPSSAGYSLPNGRELFELCFTVIGSFGVNGVITPDGLNGSVTQSGAEIGLNPRPGTVVILPSDPLLVKIPDAIDFSGMEVCLDITADFFDNLQTVRYTTIWEPSVLRFDRVENFGLPNMNASNFVLSSAGNLELNWWDFTGTTRGSTDVLYTVCFEIIGPSASCSPVEVADFPMPIFVESASNRGYNIGLDFEPGEVCAIDTRSFTFDVGTGNVLGSNPGCVPVTVTGYEDVANWSLSLAWDPARFTFQSVNGVLLNAVANTTEAAAGRVGLTYSRGDDTTIVDGTVILELCFTAVDPSANGCSPILEELRPEPNFAIENGMNFNVIVDGGEICQQAGLTVIQSVTPASCSNTSDGEIDLTVGGASGAFDFNWIGVPSSTDEDQTGLAPGVYSVVITDRGNPSITESLMITVTATTQAPAVDAGRDTLLACGTPPVVVLDATADAGTYNWRVLVSGTSIVTGQGTLRPSIFGTGPIELTVTGPSGCISKDTVEITRQIAPSILPIEQNDVPCGGGEVLQEIGVIPAGGSYTYSWSTIDGNISGPNTDMASVLVDAAGNYVILVQDTNTGCSSQASIPVNEIMGTAVADAGDDAQITCANTEATVGGTGTTDNADYELSWSTPNGSMTGSTMNATVIAAAPGDYILTVTEIATGCVVTDSVEVTGNGGVPVAQVDQTSDITCDQSTADLIGSGSTGPQFTYIWTAVSGALQGGTAIRGFSATALQPGMYEFTVKDTLTGCSRTTSTTVGDSTSVPLSQLPTNLAIDCGDTGGALIDPAYQTDSLGFVFKWVDGLGDTVSRMASLPTYSAGTYELIIENSLTGCSTTSTIQVTESDFPEAILTSTETTLICGRDSVAMDFSTSTIPTNAVISWIGGTPQVNGTTAYAVAAGSYQLVITTGNGACADTSDATIVISDSRTILTVEAGVDLQIDCQTSSVDAVATPPTDASWTINWTSTTGGTINAPTTLAGGFGESGTYVLTFRDPVSNCTGRDTLILTDTGGDNLDVLLRVSGPLPCTPDSVRIDATPVSPDNSQVTYMWRRIGDAAFVDDQTIFATQVGSYEVEMTYAPTGCTALDTIEVIGAGSANLEVSAGLDQTIPCGGGNIDLTASVIRLPDNQVSFSWIVLSGTEPMPDSTGMVTVSNSGTYEVTMTYDPTGCTVTDTVEVLPSAEFSITADAMQSIACGDTSAQLLVVVDNPTGNTLDYMWRAETGMLLTPSIQLMAEGTAGVYWFVVTDASSSCADSVRIELSVDGAGLDAAMVTYEEVSCGEIIELDGNLPAGTTGEYAAISDLGGAVIDASTNGDAEIVGLVAGDYTITYSLSSTACGTYSTDTLEVTVLGVESVKAEDELVLFTGSIRDTTIDVSLNDIVGGEGTYTLLTNTSMATMTDAGMLTSIALADSAEVSFMYEVCDLECPGNCATATVVLRRILVQTPRDFDIPNAITPNEDGLNDAFVIDELLLNPDKYPNARLIVFNRWGDVLLTSQPYNNDWKGTNNTGDDLPEGTYYYVLELDLTSTSIYKGHVTILR